VCVLEVDGGQALDREHHALERAERDRLRGRELRQAAGRSDDARVTMRVQGTGHACMMMQLLLLLLQGDADAMRELKRYATTCTGAEYDSI
jgi:hypothetical protein